MQGRASVVLKGMGNSLRVWGGCVLTGHGAVRRGVPRCYCFCLSIGPPLHISIAMPRLVYRPPIYRHPSQWHEFFIGAIGNYHLAWNHFDGNSCLHMGFKHNVGMWWMWHGHATILAYSQPSSGHYQALRPWNCLTMTFWMSWMSNEWMKPASIYQVLSQTLYKIFKWGTCHISYPFFDLSMHSFYAFFLNTIFSTRNSDSKILRKYDKSPL